MLGSNRLDVEDVGLTEHTCYGYTVTDVRMALAQAPASEVVLRLDQLLVEHPS